MKDTDWKNIGIYAAIVAVMLVLSYAFVPEVLSGKIVNQSDISGWCGTAQETVQWDRANPDNPARWSGSQFSGMPNVTFDGHFYGDWTQPLYNALLTGRRPATYLFLALLGAFLMMLAMGVNRFLALAGAIAVAFCSYNFQIIQVGHNTKMQAIAFAPWVIAALIFTYRQALEGQEKGWKSWLPLTVLGSVFFGVTLSFQVKANHQQITYYLAIIIFVYAIAVFVWSLLRENRDKFGRFVAASALLLVIGTAGIATNANKLLPTYEYAPFTMRGGSELSSNSGGAPTKGLDLEYATAWSYGWNELPNLMIPNYNGGSSNGALDVDSATGRLFRRAGQNPESICSSLPLYWGPQPFTAGPMYLGAISVFLFVLGLCVLSGKEKWWLLVSCIVAILLSLGNHLMWFTELCFKYAPFYNKFRTVSMALVTLQFCVPLLGIYALDRILKEEIPGREVVRGTWISLAITGGFCLLVAMIPAIAGDFVSASDSGMQDILVKALREDRCHILQTDAWRSFLLIVFCAATIIWCYMKNEPGKTSKRLPVAGILIGALILFDLWSVGKRYLNNNDFVNSKDFMAQFHQREADAEILKDKDLSYRVLDLAENTFNSSVASYWHKSIGGYSPAKMQRYQDLIDHNISTEIKSFYSSAGKARMLQDIQAAVPYMPVLSMLNARYIIIDGKLPPVVNPYAFGEAWFVDTAARAGSPDSEIALLKSVDLRHCAIVGADMPELPSCGADAVAGATVVEAEPYNFDTSGKIEMTYYSPNELRYSYDCPEQALAVFSEIYHPSWTAKVNGEPLPLMRADWILRAALVPAGCGEIVLQYEPNDYIIGEKISRASSILLILLALSSVIFCVFQKKN